MELGMVGLGRMGFNMTLRLLQGGHKVVGYDQNSERVKEAIKKGAAGAYSLEELVKKLTLPRVIWIMIPAGNPVEKTIQRLLTKIDPGDIIVDGGNSNYKDTLKRASILKGKNVNFVDVGTSGGIWGLKEGFCMMVGGLREVVEQLRPIFETLAPTPDRGWGYVGPNGAGHLVKMVHNGIEYGLMEAYSEGFAILKRKDGFNFDLHRIAEIWRYGSVIRSWLLDLTARALEEDSKLQEVAPYVEDTGEGRWTVFEAIDLDLSTPIITLSLLQRLRSRDKEAFSDRLIAVMRQKFGGHTIKRKKEL
jgi:6-phosphogluconate dehydrogenase